MQIVCSRHGVFELMPIAHWRREPCPLCKEIEYAREALEQGWATIEQIAEKYGATIDQVKRELVC